MIEKASEVTMVSAQFPRSLRDQIARNAQAHDRSLSATLREAARVYLAQTSPRGSSALLVDAGEGRGGAAVAPAAARREA